MLEPLPKVETSPTANSIFGLAISLAKFSKEKQGEKMFYRPQSYRVFYGAGSCA
jgi:hypothetical protein